MDFGFLSSFGVIYWFFIVLSVQTVIYWIISSPKNERKRNKKFYYYVEVLEESPLDPYFVWSFLTDPQKFMRFNYKNKIKWIKFEQPLNVGSVVKIKMRKGGLLNGFISYYEPGSRIVFEYHIWPHTTRFIWEIETARSENKTKYIVRIKVKKFLIPLLQKLRLPRRKKLINSLSEMLHRCLEICRGYDGVRGESGFRQYAEKIEVGF